MYFQLYDLLSCDLLKSKRNEEVRKCCKIDYVVLVNPGLYSERQQGDKGGRRRDAEGCQGKGGICP